MKPKDDEKQRAIAEATFTLVAQTGLSGLTMADIARTAGIATSTLYVYYPSKDELISQLYQDAKTATMQRLMEGVLPGASLRSRVRRIWGNLLRHRLQRYAEVVFQEQYYNSPWFTEGNRELSTRLAAGFLALMEEGQQQEILKPVPLPLLTASVVGSVRETAQLIRTGVLADNEAMHGAAFGLCWDAIKA
ncbi:MAG: TetR/AcrR family transcriptional regulator [Haliea sp.]|nr:MAG: TetR/AcrR family transcriptional regulator [Haliea sp.]